MPVPSWSPDPPRVFPPAVTLSVPGHGELFLRDSGGEGPVLMLLHGWIATADLNWGFAYDDLIEAGYRVIAIDHRGHGRGVRPLVPFRLVDCAADAAAALRAFGVAPATVVGYSMGGAVAQLMARDHRDVVQSLVLSGTAQHWMEPQTRRYWRAMSALGLSLALAPRASVRGYLKRVGLRPSPLMAWVQSEVMRHSARDIAEAGRELGRFDSRPWLGSIKVPCAVVITTKDSAVPQQKQRELAAAVRAQVFETPIDHLDVTFRPKLYNPALLEALATLTAHETARAA